ncbi:MAG: hypothetical protein JWO89_3520 [Verrucomicrobiaceae bacterium]|nr:hypothetical protein [Verrucomicrobiaceae bacterium]MDB6119984.1 hypothetical protein [Verrucomicrobiaceae bacterium]
MPFTLAIPRFRAAGLIKPDLSLFVIKCVVGAILTRVALIGGIVLLAQGLATSLPEDRVHLPKAPYIPASMWFSSLVLAPLWETAVFQMAPIELCRKFRVSRITCYMAGTIPFALIHAIGGVIYALAVLPVGIWLAHCYMEVRETSTLRAGLATAALHSATNWLFPWIAYYGQIITS